MSKELAQRLAQRVAARLRMAIDDGHGNTWLPPKKDGIPVCVPNYGRWCEP